MIVLAVYAETCTLVGDCTATTCGSGADLHCVDGQCTCTTAAGGTGEFKSSSQINIKIT